MGISVGIVEDHSEFRQSLVYLISSFSESKVVNSILYSFTRKGLNFILSPVEGKINSYVGVCSLGKDIMFLVC